MIPQTLEQFLKLTDWQEKSRLRLNRMRTAFNYSRQNVDASVRYRSTTDPKYGANLWAFGIDGRVTNLCA